MSNKKPTVMLDSMIQQTDDRVAVRNDVLQAFIAVHETTAYLISNIIWLFARHPEVYANLRAEVFQEIGLDASLTFDNVAKISLIKNIANEGELAKIRSRSRCSARSCFE